MFTLSSDRAVNIELRYLRYLVAVAEELNITRAADASIPFNLR